MLASPGLTNWSWSPLRRVHVKAAHGRPMPAFAVALGFCWFAVLIHWRVQFFPWTIFHLGKIEVRLQVSCFFFPLAENVSACHGGGFCWSPSSCGIDHGESKSRCRFSLSLATFGLLSVHELSRQAGVPSQLCELLEELVKVDLLPESAGLSQCGLQTGIANCCAGRVARKGFTPRGLGNSVLCWGLAPGVVQVNWGPQLENFQSHRLGKSKCFMVRAAITSRAKSVYSASL